MLEAYSVGVNLILNSNAERVLNQNIAKFQRFNAVVKTATKEVQAFDAAMKALNGSTAIINRVTRAMERLDKAQTGARGGHRAMADMANEAQRLAGITAQLSTLMRTNAQLAQQTAQAMQAAATAQQRSARAAQAAPVGYGRGGYGHTGFGTGMAASAALEGGGRSLIRGSVEVLDRGIDLRHQQTIFNSDQRVTPAVRDSARQAIEKATMSAPGFTLGQGYKAMVDLRNEVGFDRDGTLGTVEKMLPAFARMTATLQVMDRAKGGKGDQAGAAMRAMDILGGLTEDFTDEQGNVGQRLNPQLLQERLDKITKVAVLTNMRVDPSAYLGFAKQARSAGMLLSDEFIYEKLPALMDATGGQRAGTALMSMFQTFRKGGTLTDKNYDKLAEIGLAGPATVSRQIDPKSRRIQHTRTEPGIYDADLMFRDPVLWAAKASERMTKAGVVGVEAQIKALDAQRSTITGFLADILKSQISIDRFQENFRNQRPDIGAHFADNDPVAKLQQVQAAWDKLLATAGDAAMDTLIKYLDLTTNALNGMAAWAKEHPRTAETLIEVGLGLGALATGLGIVSTAMFAMGPALALLRGGVPIPRGGIPPSALSSLLAVNPATAAIAAVGTSLVVGSQYETPETRDAQDRLSRTRRFDPMAAPQDGYDTQGRPHVIAPNAARTPLGSAPTRIQLQGDLNMDGRKVGSLLANGMAAEASGPSRGTTGPDMRINLGVQ